MALAAAVLGSAPTPNIPHSLTAGGCNYTVRENESVLWAVDVPQQSAANESYWFFGNLFCPRNHESEPPSYHGGVCANPLHLTPKTCTDHDALCSGKQPDCSPPAPIFNAVAQHYYPAGTSCLEACATACSEQPACVAWTLATQDAPTPWDFGCYGVSDAALAGAAALQASDHFVSGVRTLACHSAVPAAHALQCPEENAFNVHWPATNASHLAAVHCTATEDAVRYCLADGVWSDDTNVPVSCEDLHAVQPPAADGYCDAGTLHFACLDITKELWVVGIILVCLLLVSFAFEFGIEWTEHKTHSSRLASAVLEAVRGEIFMLGLLSFLLFVLEYTLQDSLSSSAHHIVELFEFVHMTLFVAVMFFLLTSIYLALWTRRSINDWTRWETTPWSRVYKKYQGNKALKSLSYRSSTLRDANLRFHFHMIRCAFLHENVILHLPKATHAKIMHPNNVFFTQYLVRVLRESLTRCVKLGWRVWGIFLLLVGMGTMGRGIYKATEPPCRTNGHPAFYYGTEVSCHDHITAVQECCDLCTTWHPDSHGEWHYTSTCSAYDTQSPAHFKDNSTSDDGNDSSAGAHRRRLLSSAPAAGAAVVVEECVAWFLNETTHECVLMGDVEQKFEFEDETWDDMWYKSAEACTGSKYDTDTEVNSTLFLMMFGLGYVLMAATIVSRFLNFRIIQCIGRAVDEQCSKMSSSRSMRSLERGTRQNLMIESPTDNNDKQHTARKRNSRQRAKEGTLSPATDPRIQERRLTQDSISISLSSSLELEDSIDLDRLSVHSDLELSEHSTSISSDNDDEHIHATRNQSIYIDDSSVNPLSMADLDADTTDDDGDVPSPREVLRGRFRDVALSVLNAAKLNLKLPSSAGAANTDASPPAAPSAAKQKFRRVAFAAARANLDEKKKAEDQEQAGGGDVELVGGPSPSPEEEEELREAQEHEEHLLRKMKTVQLDATHCFRFDETGKFEVKRCPCFRRNKHPFLKHYPFHNPDSLLIFFQSAMLIQAVHTAFYFLVFMYVDMHLVYHLLYWVPLLHFLIVYAPRELAYFTIGRYVGPLTHYPSVESLATHFMRRTELVQIHNLIDAHFGKKKHGHHKSH